MLKWNEQLLGTIRANPPSTGPTITSRALGILQTAEFDAWAAYDPVATGTRLGSQLRRPAAERTAANKDKAIMADQAGMSRRYGGIHFESGDQRGRTLGALTGLDVWQTAQEYFAGTPG